MVDRIWRRELRRILHSQFDVSLQACCSAHRPLMQPHQCGFATLASRAKWQVKGVEEARHDGYWRGGPRDLEGGIEGNLGSGTAGIVQAKLVEVEVEVGSGPGPQKSNL